MESESLLADLPYLSPALAELGEASHAMQMPTLPSDKLCESLKALWQLETLELEVGEPQWREGGELLAGFPEETLSVAVASPQLPGELCCVVGQRDLETLCFLILKSDPTAISLSGEEFQEAFWRFLGVTLLDQLTALNFPPQCTFGLTGLQCPKEAPSLCYTVAMRSGAHRLSARLILSKELVHSLRQTFAVKKPLELAPERAKLLQVEVAIVAGTTGLTQEEWQGLKVGDFVTLDHCGVDPSTAVGRVTLATEDKTLISGELTPSGVKLIGDDSHDV